jgi:uncharacterized membrane protein
MAVKGRKAHDEHEAILLERLTFFSDAVFAIAITLLVIEVHVPELPHATDWDLGTALIERLPNYIGFVSSFLVIGRFWVGHHQLFGLLKATNMRLVWANLFLLLVIAFMPFPTAVLSNYVNLRVGVCFYCAWLALIGLVNVVVTRIALGGRVLVRDDASTFVIEARRRGSWVAVVIGVSAFLTGLVTPLAALGALTVVSPLASRLMRPKMAEAEV